MTTTFLTYLSHSIKLMTTIFLTYATLWHSQWTKYSSTPPLSGTPSGQNTYSTPHLHHSLVPQWTKYLLTSSPPQLRHSLALPVDKILLNSAALWYPQWTKYLLNSSPPPLSGTPVDKISPHLLTSSTPPLSGTPVDKIPPQLHRSLVPPVDKIPPHLLIFTALWHPK